MFRLGDFLGYPPDFIGEYKIFHMGYCEFANLIGYQPRSQGQGTERGETLGTSLFGSLGETWERGCLVLLSFIACKQTRGQEKLPSFPTPVRAWLAVGLCSSLKSLFAGQSFTV